MSFSGLKKRGAGIKRMRSDPRDVGNIENVLSMVSPNDISNPVSGLPPGLARAGIGKLITWLEAYDKLGKIIVIFNAFAQ